jgi:hypothetical protein
LFTTTNEDDLFEQLNDPRRRPPHGSRAAGIARRAARVVGSDDASRLRWLIRFAENDRPPDLGSAAVAAEIEAFAGRGGVIARNIGALLTRNTVAELLEIVQAGLRAYVSGATPSFPPLDFQYLEFALVPGSSRGPWMGPWRALFLIALAEVVGSEHNRLRACSRPDCGRLFFRRKAGAYCSRQCSKEQRMSRFRRDPVRYSEKRHQYYVQRMARLKGISPKAMSKMVKRRKRDGGS